MGVKVFGTTYTKNQKVSGYIKEYRDSIKDTKHRQCVHFDTPIGWLNDPKGLIYFKGYYHLFYQFNPYAPKCGSMHWGHARSKDLIEWEHMDVALAPSEFYDDDNAEGSSPVHQSLKMICSMFFILEQF